MAGYYPSYMQTPGMLQMMQMGITDPTQLAPGMQPGPFMGGLPPGVAPPVPGGVPVGSGPFPQAPMPLPVGPKGADPTARQMSDESSFANQAKMGGQPLHRDPGGGGYTDIPQTSAPPAPPAAPLSPAPAAKPSGAPQGSLNYAPDASAGSDAPRTMTNMDMAKEFGQFGKTTPGAPGTMQNDASRGITPSGTLETTNRNQASPNQNSDIKTPSGVDTSGNPVKDTGFWGKLAPMNNRLMEMGMGMMSGNRYEQMANAQKGFAQGSADDRAQVQEDRQKQADAQEKTAAIAYAQLAKRAGYPELAKQIEASPKMAKDLFGAVLGEQGIDAGRFTATDRTKNYQYDVAHGYKGGFHDWLLEQEQAGSAKSEGSFASGLGKATVDRLNGNITNAAMASSKLQQLKYMEEVLNKSNQGYFSNAYKNVGEIAAALGIDNATLKSWGFNNVNAPATEQAQALVSQYIYSNFLGADKGGLPVNNFSEEDRRAVQAMGPQLKNTPEGNRLMIEKMKIDQQIHMALNDSWTKYAAEKGGANGGVNEENYRQWEQTEQRKVMQGQHWYAPLYNELDRLEKGGGTKTATPASTQKQPTDRPAGTIYDINGRPIQ